MKGLGLAVLLSTPALAYWAPNHVELNKQILEEAHPWGEAGFTFNGRPVKTVDDYLKNVIYLSHGIQEFTWGVPFNELDSERGKDLPGDFPTQQRTLASWASEAGRWEDGFVDLRDGMKWAGLRAVNHFHDPLSSGGGYTGPGLIKSTAASGLPFGDVLRSGISATQWVFNGSSGGAANAWGYPTMLDSILRAYTEEEPKRREAGFGKAFRSLGQIAHLIADNTVPDHVRNLAHPGRGFEEHMADLNAKGTKVFRHFPREDWKTFPLTSIESQGLRALWDRDLYSTNSSSAVSGDGQGVSEYVNSNFFGYSVAGGVYFTSIPNQPGEGYRTIFSGSSSLAVQSFPAGFLVTWLDLHFHNNDFEMPVSFDTSRTLIPGVNNRRIICSLSPSE